jgi:hypothetical protein
VTKTDLLKKLDNMLAQSDREKTWGQIEIELRDGQPTLLRKTSTERLDADRERTHEQQQTYRR